MQNALLKSCEKYLHQDHSAKAFPGAQHWVSKAQQAEGKRWVQFKEKDEAYRRLCLSPSCNAPLGSQGKQLKCRFIVEKQVQN